MFPYRKEASGKNFEVSRAFENEQISRGRPYYREPPWEKLTRQLTQCGGG